MAGILTRPRAYLAALAAIAAGALLLALALWLGLIAGRLPARESALLAISASAPAAVFAASAHSHPSSPPHAASRSRSRVRCWSSRSSCA